MKCSRCGTENPKGKSVCKNCGAFLYSANPNNRVPLTKKQKKERRVALFKGTAMGCLWSSLIIVGMFILLGILSYIMVRFVIPDEYFEDMTYEATDTTGSEAGSPSSSP